jgi:hypothetical protein
MHAIRMCMYCMYLQYERRVKAQSVPRTVVNHTQLNHRRRVVCTSNWEGPLFFHTHTHTFNMQAFRRAAAQSARTIARQQTRRHAHHESPAAGSIKYPADEKLGVGFHQPTHATTARDRERERKNTREREKRKRKAKADLIHGEPFF